MDISSLRERGDGMVSVSELNNYIKKMFDSSRFLASVTVKGEISNFTLHRSGHLYFSLKDSESNIKAVMFRSSAARLKFMPETGMKVIVHGSVSVFERDGAYQLYVTSMQPDGIGALYLAFEQLKSKLESEGLFSDEYKKKIPRFPEKIGVITSPTGAAVRDIINVIGRRFPSTTIFIYPALVQGEGSEESLIKGLDYFEKSGLVDTIIIGRGGGSIEDLWSFNSERLARKIFEIKTPIISAVGHETDFTICDFVCDLRAPTPSAAAELAVPDIRALYMQLDGSSSRLSALISRKFEIAEDKFIAVKEKVLSGLMDNYFATFEDALLLTKKSAVDSIIRKLERDESSFITISEKISALSPLSVLQRGYSVVSDSGGKPLSVSDAKIGDIISVKTFDGKIMAEVTKICEEKNEQ